ncbi:hypothetical protein [Actinosynnema sp. NPDC023587]|uniref:tetratricopeptide repeat protein n=1 Tax=Actinosynnema sp. NPDC023587 TaxID=3154695 RepID=UPI0034086DCF
MNGIGDGAQQFRQHLVDALCEMITDEPSDAVADLVAYLWLLAPEGDDSDWCRPLLLMADQVAATLPASLALATAFRRGAEFFRARGHYPLAVSQGLRELAVHRARDDRISSGAALQSLAVTYRAQGRMHRVVDCADGILEDCIACRDETGIASMLGHLGCLMAEVGRHSAAVGYFDRAKALYEKLSDTSGVARCHVQVARVHLAAGDRRAANRRLRHVLAQCIGLDYSTANHVQALLATPSGTAAPASPWPEFGDPTGGLAWNGWSGTDASTT